MKCFLLVLAVVSVFADPRSGTSFEVSQPFEESIQVDNPFEDSKELENSFEDSQQELETLNNEDDKGNNPAVVPTSKHLCSINVPALVKMIKYVINKKLASQPVVQMLYLSISSTRVLSIRKIRGGSFKLGPILNTIQIGNGQTSRTSSILAYRQRYNGYHNTRLGAVFLNLERLFPCAGKGGLVPVCRRFTQEEDGFFKGKTITEAADIGNNMRIFGKDIKTYGFVFERCSRLSGVNKDCLPTYFQTVVTCFLPRACL